MGHIKTKGELKRSGRVCSSCCNSGTCCATIVKNLLTSHGRGKEDRIVTTTNGIYLVICDIFLSRKSWKEPSGLEYRIN
jgi:hypothetical protein